MNVCLTLFVVCGVLAVSDAKTCKVCKTEYEAVTTKTCTTINTYIDCLIAAPVGDEGCETRNDKMKEANDARTYKGTCTALTSTCTCQIAYHLPIENADKCRAYKTETKCLVAATGLACDGSTKYETIATQLNSDIGDFITCVLTKTCDCQMKYAATDVSTAAGLCTAYKAEIKCLEAAGTALACDGSATQAVTIAAAKSALEANTACVTDTCECEVKYIEADKGDTTKKCAAYNAELDCLLSATSTACDNTVTHKVYIEAVQQSAIANPCTVTDTCKCQTAYAAADTSDSVKQCVAYKAELKCLNASTSVACDGSTTQAVTIAAVRTAVGAIATCDSAGVHISVTFVLPLLVAIFVGFSTKH